MHPESKGHKKRVTIVGGARSGIAALKLLHSQGASVFLSEYSGGSEELVRFLESGSYSYELGGHTEKALDTDFIVISPGVPSTIPLLREAQKRGIPIYSEIEVASWYSQAPVVAITGSNGKTTTTSLLGHVFSQSDRKAHVAGNIGKAFSEIALDTREEDVVVLEVSSFQLDHIHRFRPAVSILLNITPDHLDRYENKFEKYAASKFKIFSNQLKGDALIYNFDDELVRNRVSRLAPSRQLHTYGISQKQELRDGAFLRGDTLVVRLNQAEEIIMRKEDLALKGPHNVFNSLAAAMAARVMEIPSLAVRESLSTFEGVAHRLEFVRNLDDVQYVNDSKATNVNAVWYALESFQQQIVLIAGGRDKGNDYSSLVPLVQDKVRVVIGLGESAEKVEQELGIHAEQHMLVDSLEQAVQAAHLFAQPGEVVLLSPACASFDMFENYEARGEAFKQAVHNL